MDFLDRLKQKLEGLSETPPIIEIGVYNESTNSVALSPTPSSINVRYLNEDKIYPFSFQMLVHHKDNKAAYAMSEKIRHALDGKGENFIVSNDGSFKLSLIECTTTPNFVQKTNYGALWTAIYRADLQLKGDE